MLNIKDLEVNGILIKWMFKGFIEGLELLQLT